MITDTLHARRSMRRYADQPVPPDLIDQFLKAATYAPSAHHRRPWQVAIAND